MRANRTNQFDRIAGIYDTLARLVYGQNIRESQCYWLDQIPEGSKILILGGGTGMILEDLESIKSAIEVWYIEPSPKMLVRSTRRKTNFNVHFIQGTELNIPALEVDVVITNFYLDLFPEKELQAVVRTIAPCLRREGIWIATDFVDEKKWWQGLLLFLMYQFFRFACAIQASALPTWEDSLQTQGLRVVKKRNFFGGFISSIVLERANG